MTGGCLLVAFAPDGATGNDDDDDDDDDTIYTQISSLFDMWRYF